MITLIYVAEFIIKVIAMGFVMTENSYLRDHWNKSDFFIVIVSILGLVARDS